MVDYLGLKPFISFHWKDVMGRDDRVVLNGMLCDVRS